MSIITITDSFDRALPTGRKSSSSTPSATISGTSTRAADPPDFAFEVSFDDVWNDHATTVLDNIDLTAHKLASWEHTREFRVEGDVEDASAVHLINPVDLALSTWTSGTARVDKCWLRRIPGGTRPFAALDYKKAGVIREDEYQEALRDPANYQQLANHAWGTDSSFTGNSAILLKQGVNYANQYETKYIAFFDWNSLLLLVLTDQEGTSVRSLICGSD